MKQFGKRLDKLEALTSLAPEKKAEMMVKRRLKFLGTLDLKTINDLILFESEISWHRRKGNKDAEAEVWERIERYCEGKKVKVVVERRAGGMEDEGGARLSHTAVQNPNAPRFEDLRTHTCNFEDDEELKRCSDNMLLADIGGR